MSDHKIRLKTLRQEMSSHNIDAYIVPQADQWQAESLFPCDERLHYICGLIASAGYVVVTRDKAVVLIDHRYTVQAKEQVDSDLFDIAYYTDILPEDWAVENIRAGGVIGFDPWLFTQKDLKRFEGKNLNIKAIEGNLIDKIWDDRPALPNLVAIHHDIQFAGNTTDEKLDVIAEFCDELTLISAPDSLAWLLNVRVLENTQAPGLRGYGIFDPSDCSLGVYTDVNLNNIEFNKIIKINKLNDILNVKNKLNIPQSAPAWFKGNVIDSDPCDIPKSCKNETEQRGIRNSHLRDAQAVIETIHWIKKTPNLTEKNISEKLIGNRAKQNMFRGVSFDSIVGWNANGAKIHGSPTDTKIKGDGLLLIDSGGQYDDGTTDITRTIAIGTPSDEMREKYTLVLKAHIALATAIFPAGTNGIQLDAICRAPMWNAGIDFAHGTGHGVGHFLNVHEGPCGISPRVDQELMEGMLLSNEPGYYKEGAFGIRLENLMLVQKYKDAADNETGKDLLHFETVTKVPFDEDCIVLDMLSAEEKKWLNTYHASCG